MTYSLNASHLDRMLGRWQSQGPAYLDLANAFRTLIMDGRLPLGSRLPAERSLAPQLGISRNTVTAAYRLLREQGYLQSLRGNGSFITIPADHQQSNRIASWIPAGQDRDAIDFTIASPQASTSFFDATQSLHDDIGGNVEDAGYDLQGISQLRRLLADRYTSLGLPTSPSEVMVTAGAQHAWGLLIRLLTKERDQVLMESPTYPNAVDAVRSLNRQTLMIGLDGSDWHTDLIQTTISRRKPALSYFMADFHNPTGLVMPEETRNRVIASTEKAGGHVVFDETLSDLALDEDSPLRPTTTHRSPHVIMIGSFSKIVWAGLRLGWVRAPAPLISRLVTLRAAADAGNSIVPQIIACRLLESYADVLRERRRSLRQGRDVLADAVRRLLPRWSFRLPDGGLSLWIDLGARVSSRLALVAPEHGVRLLPGSRFGADSTLDNYLRLPFVHDEATAREGVVRLAAAFDQVMNDHDARRPDHQAPVPRRSADRSLAMTSGHGFL
ncbi:PLP-dependent aminotransferase family protein [Lentzea sp. NPDC004782]|uniref:MocR-like transcription factor YczR n=1 Tax=Lentzea sp. NPDC004782 TaxID=3154458 RepID=UPI0033BAB2F3